MHLKLVSRSYYHFVVFRDFNQTKISENFTAFSTNTALFTLPFLPLDELPFLNRSLKHGARLDGTGRPLTLLHCTALLNSRWWHISRWCMYSGPEPYCWLVSPMTAWFTKRLISNRSFEVGEGAAYWWSLPRVPFDENFSRRNTSNHQRRMHIH